MEAIAEGTPFGRYRPIELLGRGGMGEVWRDYDTLIERTVALTVLPAVYADDPQYREPFRREALKAASLDQRHIVTILDVTRSLRRIASHNGGVTVATGTMRGAAAA